MTTVLSADQRRAAEHDIARLILTYAHLLDDGDFQAVGDLFANATWQLSADQRTTGKAEKVALLERGMRLYGGKPGTRHVISNIVTDVADDGATARSRCYVHTTQVIDGFPLQLIFQGRYDDTFAFADGRWVFTDRTVLADGIGDMSHHQR